VVGLSARALSESALRAGFHPASVDLFGDLDLRRRVPNLSLARDLGAGWEPRAAAEAARALPPGIVVYGADLENAPGAVARLARGRELLGNPPSVLRRVRDPALLLGALSAAGLPVPATVLPRRLRRSAGTGSLSARVQSAPGPRRGPAATWLRKPRARGGGLGIRTVEAGARPRRSEILQELLEGPAVGFSFIADGREVRPLALAAMIDDRSAFGAPPFAYCGSLGALPHGADGSSLREQALAAARAATRAFGLRGWAGMDFVLRRGELVPIEVNPRHTASMDLHDSASNPLFALHASACRGRLDPGAGWLPAAGEVPGKAVLWARGEVVVGSSDGWPAAEDPVNPPAVRVADVPFPGDVIAAGRPVCSLYAAGASDAECLERLRALAARVERDLSPPAPDAVHAAGAETCRAADA
jgi:predicted ATP-grasp superfamily ATP-dependent carboligase